MKLSDYQIVSVIKTYIRNMRGSVELGEGVEGEGGGTPPVPADGIKKMVYERIEERMAEKLRRHETE